MTQLTLEQVALDCYTAMLNGWWANPQNNEDGIIDHKILNAHAFNYAEAFIAERNKRYEINKPFAEKLAEECFKNHIRAVTKATRPPKFKIGDKLKCKNNTLIYTVKGIDAFDHNKIVLSGGFYSEAVYDAYDFEKVEE